jgi:sugar lactone lactonase YvrE
MTKPASPEPTCVWPLGASLGEGPMWDRRTDTLWFVDIKQGRVHRYDPASRARDTIEVGGLPCFIVPSDDGGFILGNHHSLQRFDGRRVTATHKTIAMHAANRLNDATVDRDGRLWFGSMDDAERAASGLVYRHDRGAITIAGCASIITNGPAVSTDGKRLYHVDTIARAIWRFAIREDGSLADGAIFAHIDPADGSPDGVVIDAADYLWVGLWGGWQARRYTPDGEIAQIVRFPCSQVTKLAFGGADLRTAFATTASVGLDAASLAQQPLAGALFAFPVDTPGIPLPAMRLGTEL